MTKVPDCLAKVEQRRVTGWEKDEIQFGNWSIMLRKRRDIGKIMFPARKNYVSSWKKDIQFGKSIISGQKKAGSRLEKGRRGCKKRKDPG